MVHRARLRAKRVAAVPPYLLAHGAEKTTEALKWRSENIKSKPVIRLSLIQTEAKLSFDLFGGGFRAMSPLSGALGPTRASVKF